jgi:ribosomal protein S7
MVSKKLKLKNFKNSLQTKLKNLKARFVGCLTKKGKKLFFEKVFSRILFKLAKKFNVKPKEIILKIKQRLNTFVETRSVKIRRNRFLVPIPVPRARRDYLIVKRILNTINRDKTKESLEKKLWKELIIIYKKTNSKSSQERKKTIIEASKNRSNSHFRW